MCGGAGTRLDADAEKPLVEVGGAPMVERVRRALADSRVERIHAAVSPKAPETRSYLRSRPCAVVETPGGGYVADLEAALDRVGRPALTVAADLPLLAPGPVDRALDAAERTEERYDDGDGDGDADDVRSLAVCVPAALKRRLGASVDEQFERDGRALAPTGCNVVAAGPDAVRVSYDARLAANVNRPADLELAEALVGAVDGPEGDEDEGG